MTIGLIYTNWVTTDHD